MRHRGWPTLALSISLACLVGIGARGGDGRSATPPKKVLVELFSTQGARSSPPASELLGRLARLGYGPDRVEIVHFHVDSANQPWVDPYSHPDYTRRRLAYSLEHFRQDRAPTAPLVVIDGRSPILGADQAATLAAIERASRESPGVALDLHLDGSKTRKTLAATLRSPAPGAVGLDLMVGVALTEDPVSTRVTSGENAGRTLAERRVVLRFDRKAIRLDPRSPRSVVVPLELPAGRDAGRIRVAVFAQDPKDGRVLQADSVPWAEAEGHDHASTKPEHDHGRRPGNTKERRAAALRRLATLSGQAAPGGPSSSSDDEASCPDCGTPYSPQYRAAIRTYFSQSRPFGSWSPPPAAPPC